MIVLLCIGYVVVAMCAYGVLENMDPGKDHAFVIMWPFAILVGIMFGGPILLGKFSKYALKGAVGRFRKKDEERLRALANAPEMQMLPLPDDLDEEFKKLEREAQEVADKKEYEEWLTKHPDEVASEFGFDSWQARKYGLGPTGKTGPMLPPKPYEFAITSCTTAAPSYAVLHQPLQSSMYDAWDGARWVRLTQAIATIDRLPCKPSGGHVE